MLLHITHTVPGILGEESMALVYDSSQKVKTQMSNQALKCHYSVVFSFFQYIHLKVKLAGNNYLILVYSYIWKI